MRKDDKVEKCIVAMIDETGDTGSRTHGDYYIVGATVVDRDKIRAFANITKEYNVDCEMKFNTDIRERETIIDKSSKLDIRLYAVTVEKPISPNWDTKEQLNVHRVAVFHLMDRIVRDENADRVLMVIDENNKAKPPRLKEMGDRIAERYGKKVIVAVKRSEDDFHLQTNDFHLGGMGKKYNRGNDSYVGRTGVKVKREILIFEGKKLLRTIQE
jgi:hypothetical protein